jgi:hypothetical protein
MGVIEILSPNFKVILRNTYILDGYIGSTMTTGLSCNCIVCAQEFTSDELQSVALSKINVTRFKICQACLDQCDPTENYRQAREIINSYLWFADARTSFKEAAEILEELSKK